MSSTLNATIRAEMARHRVTQTSLAGAIGITQSAVSARLAGRTDWKITELVKVATALGVELDTLTAGVAA